MQNSPMKKKEVLEESGMLFLCEKENTFLCEDYTQSLGIDGIKTVEYVEIRKWKKDCPLLCFIEAKKPYAKNVSLGGSGERFGKYVGDIEKKLRDSLSTLSVVLLKRRDPDRMPTEIRMQIQKVPLRFILVIKDLDEVKEKNQFERVKMEIFDTMKNDLDPIFRLWKFGPTPLMVLSEQEAVKRGFVLGAQDFS